MTLWSRAKASASAHRMAWSHVGGFGRSARRGVARAPRRAPLCERPEPPRRPSARRKTGSARTARRRCAWAPRPRRCDARPVKEFPSVATSARRWPARRRSSERRLPLGPTPPGTPRTIGPPRRRVRLPRSRMHPRRRRPARASPDTDRGSRPSVASGARAPCFGPCRLQPSAKLPCAMLGHHRVTTHHAR
jgi:hypothetical protein